MSMILDPDYEREQVIKARRDLGAFEGLYNLYFARIYSYVCYRVGKVQDCEDLASDIFLKAAEALRREQFEWRRHGSFAAWLFRIAHNAVIDYYRRNPAAVDAPMSLDELPMLQAGGLLPDDALVRKEQFAHLRQELLTLSPRRQEIITLKFFGGLRNTEIAAVLGLDERTIASHLCRGLEDLHRRYLQARLHEERVLGTEKLDMEKQKR